MTHGSTPKIFRSIRLQGIVENGTFHYHLNLGILLLVLIETAMLQSNKPRRGRLNLKRGVATLRFLQNYHGTDHNLLIIVLETQWMWNNISKIIYMNTSPVGIIIKK